MSVEQYILIIEDSPEDFEATARALQKVGLHNHLHRCQNGDEALEFLRSCATGKADAILPSIILLDLNLPGTDGRDILRTIKNNESLKQIPVIILSTSGSDTDVRTCYDRGANAYLKKPYNLSGFVDIASVLKKFWFEYALLP